MKRELVHTVCGAGHGAGTDVGQTRRGLILAGGV